MDSNAIKQALEFPGNTFPREAMQAAIEQREAITPLLLQVLQDTLDNPQSVKEAPGYWLHIFALFLLAQFREPRAYPLMVQLFSLPGNLPGELLGDVLTESMPNLLASVCGDDLQPIKGIIENPSLDESARASAIETLEVLVAVGRLDRGTVIDYFRELFTDRLEREPSFVWTALVIRADYLHPGELMPQIRQAYADELPDRWFIGDIEVIEATLEKDPAEVLARLRKHRPNLIDDSIAELSNWVAFRDEPKKPSPRSVPTPPGRVLSQPNGMPVTRQPKIGRNDPCPCGSGKKHKKCCLNKA